MPPAIINSLLRIDDVTGVPQPPFERPNDKMDFFVLELGLDDDVGNWCARTTEILSANAEFLGRMRGAGSNVALFVESAASVPVLRFEASFLGVLAKAGISLGCRHEDD
ncbi:MAG TPA: hypothetical protein VIT91_14815 [Chthoniobacterales bacterium]